MGQMHCRKTEKDLKAEPFSVVLTAEDKKTASRPTNRQSQTDVLWRYVRACRERSLDQRCQNPQKRPKLFFFLCYFWLLKQLIAFRTDGLISEMSYKHYFGF